MRYFTSLFRGPKLLGQYIPRAFLSQRKADEWESILLDEFQRVAFDPISSPFEGKVRYLTKLKSLCKDYYGSVFYEGSELVEESVTKDGKTKSIVKKYPSLLAMNMNGIFMFRKDGAQPTTAGSDPSKASKAFSSFKSFLSKATSSAPQATGPTSPLDKYKHVLIRSNQFKEIIGWSLKPETSSFQYSVPGSTPDHSETFAFESPLYDEMPDACQEIVDLILQQMQKEGAADDAAPADETANSANPEQSD